MKTLNLLVSSALVALSFLVPPPIGGMDDAPENNDFNIGSSSQQQTLSSIYPASQQRKEPDSYPNYGARYKPTYSCEEYRTEISSLVQLYDDVSAADPGCLLKNISIQRIVETFYQSSDLSYHRQLGSEIISSPIKWHKIKKIFEELKIDIKINGDEISGYMEKLEEYDESWWRSYILEKPEISEESAITLEKEMDLRKKVLNKIKKEVHRLMVLYKSATGYFHPRWDQLNKMLLLDQEYPSKEGSQ